MTEIGFAIAKEPFRDANTGKSYARGDRVFIDEAAKMARWTDQGLICPIVLEQALEQRLDDWPWGGFAGQDLRPWGKEPVVGTPVIALLNVWNDRNALEVTVPTWSDHVDGVVVADGAYAGVPVDRPGSTDGSIEYLREVFGSRLTELPVNGFRSQIEKRTALLQAGPGVAFIVDADEFVYGADNLRQLRGDWDVGWVFYRNTIYERTQKCPRLIRWREGLRYAGRHHWVYEGERLLCSHQLGGAGYDHRVIPVMVDNRRGIARPPDRRQADSVYRAVQAAAESGSTGEDLSSSKGREPLRIVQLARFDAGMVCYRLHSAINSCTPHESILGTADWERCYAEPHQYHLGEHREVLRRAVAMADVVHCHLQYHDLDMLAASTNRQAVVIHHHGTMYRSSPEAANERDRRRAGLRLISNLELLEYGDDLQYLPNPVPVAQYRRLRRKHDSEGLVVAHTPSKPEIKGTVALTAAVDRLRAEGLPIRSLTITDARHSEALKLKAKADVCFDSFALGMQCSGLEAAAMGMPVVAGDARVKAAYERWIGYCPYTFAGDAAELEAVLRRFVEDPDWRESEAKRVSSYVEEYHDYAAVAEKYLELLEGAFGWKEKLTLGQVQPLTG